MYIKTLIQVVVGVVVGMWCIPLHWPPNTHTHTHSLTCTNIHPHKSTLTQMVVGVVVGMWCMLLY